MVAENVVALHLVDDRQSAPVSETGAPVGADDKVNDSLQSQLAVPFGSHVTDTHPRARVMPLAELIADFSRPETTRGRLSSAEYHALNKEVPEEKRKRNAEKNGRYFCVARFRDGGSRIDKHVEALWGFALDFDTGRTTESIIRERLQGVTYIAYTSYSHRVGDERWRVIIPYTRDIAPKAHKAVFKHFQELFDGDLDLRCEVPSQAWYTPACPYDAAGNFKCFHEIGDLFDPAFLILGEALAGSAPSPKNSVTKDLAAQLKRLEAALMHVESEDRQVWVKVGLAINHDLGGAGLQLWLDWSARSAKFDHDEAVKTWESFKPRAPGETTVTLGSVFHMAKAAGWKEVARFVEELNKEYFVAPFGGKVAIFHEHVDATTGFPKLTPMQKADFSLLYANRFVLVPQPNGDAKEVPMADAWLKHRDRRQYKGVILSPAENPPGYYNCWRGFNVTPAKGNWRRMRRHILFIVCSGDRHLYRYVLGWLARGIQYPEKRAEVALVLRGGRGAGKGMFVRAFGELFGPHFVHLTHSRHLTGNFNAHLADALFVFADEAFYAGDKSGEAALKGLITEPALAIEPKFFNVEMAPNRLKVAMASNSEWVVPAGIDERRFCVIDVSDARQQDTTYFQNLVQELDSGGREAMLHDLLRRDLRRFNIRTVPNTEALKAQKILSLTPIQRWWLDKLMAGTWYDAPPLSPHIDHWQLIPKNVVHDDYVVAMKKVGTTHRSSETELGMALRKLLPPGWPRTNRSTLQGSAERAYMYGFPPLDECRTHFEKLSGMEGRVWPEGAPPHPADKMLAGVYPVGPGEPAPPEGGVSREVANLAVQPIQLD